MSEAAEATDPGPIRPDPEAIAAVLDDSSDQRKWLNAVKELTSTRFEEPFSNPNVQIAYEDMLIAAFERVERILRSDVVARGGE